MFVLMVLVSIAGHTTSSTVSGRVTSEVYSGPIDGAIVTPWPFCPDSAATDTPGFYNALGPDSTIAGSRGFYSIRAELLPSVYSLDAAHRGYLSTTHSFAIDTAKQLRVDLQMHPQPLEMPAVSIETTSVPAEIRRHNDSMLGPLRGLKFVHTRPWLKREGESRVPDSSAIRFNNEAAKSALRAFQHRSGSGLFRRHVSYNLCGDNVLYLMIGHGRCRLVVDYGRQHRASLNDVDSLRVVLDTLDTNELVVPDWAALPQYVPLRLEVYVREVGRWQPVVRQYIMYTQ
jgi:hypothetical protein